MCALCACESICARVRARVCAHAYQTQIGESVCPNAKQAANVRDIWRKCLHMHTYHINALLYVYMYNHFAFHVKIKSDADRCIVLGSRLPTGAYPCPHRDAHHRFITVCGPKYER